jgi:pyocin large subunit-like protein
VTEPSQEVTKFEADHFGNAERSTGHFEDHAADFGYQTEEEYVNGASNFLREAEQNGYPARVDSMGNVRVYDPTTNRFAVYDSNNGVIRSFYKPSSSTYWERNSPSWGKSVQWK